MTTKPTYNVTELKGVIAYASLDNIKRISKVLKREHEYFTSKEMSELLVLITKRLIELSNGVMH